jgi:XTP/dITP diphosphohydrolase
MNPLASSFLQLVTIMDELREQCPWDKKQTIDTLRSMTIEETYELADAITSQDWNGIREELGDVLLHILFYARIGKEENKFQLQEVIDGIAKKLIDRHPHIYGDVKVENEEDVKRNWEKLKLKEGKTSVLSGVPVSLPALVATRMQVKAKQVGFEWKETAEVWNKVEEEIGELKEAVLSSDVSKIEDEFGDVLFSLVNYARFIGVDPESALEKTNLKFKTRFMYMEAQATAQGKSLGDMTLSEMDVLWNEAKTQ